MVKTERKTDVHMMIRRKKTTIFLDAKETTTVMEVKKKIEGILKVPTDRMQLSCRAIMDDDRQLSDYGITYTTAKAYDPARIALALRDTTTGDFEPLEITPYSTPPELPDILKPPSERRPRPQQ